MAHANVIGLVVEGPTEYSAIPVLLQRLGIRHTTPSSFNGQSVHVPLRDLVKYRLLKHVLVQLSRNTDLVLVILDVEDRPLTAEKFSEALCREIRKQVAQEMGRKAAAKVEVVACMRRFENWLIADPKGLTKSALIAKDLSSQVACHADDRDALAMLSGAMAKGIWYRKAYHGPKLIQHVRVHQPGVSLCSQSLRRFIQIVTS